MDCTSESVLARLFSISSYPTLKLLHPTEQWMRTYRGPRNIAAFRAFALENGYLQQEAEDIPVVSQPLSHTHTHTQRTLLLLTPSCLGNTD